MRESGFDSLWSLRTPPFFPLHKRVLKYDNRCLSADCVERFYSQYDAVKAQTIFFGAVDTIAGMGNACDNGN